MDGVRRSDVMITVDSHRREVAEAARAVIGPLLQQQHPGMQAMPRIRWLHLLIARPAWQQHLVIDALNALHVLRFADATDKSADALSAGGCRGRSQLCMHGGARTRCPALAWPT